MFCDIHNKECFNPCEGVSVGSVGRCFKCQKDIFTWEDFRVCGGQGNIMHQFWGLIYCQFCSGYEPKKIEEGEDHSDWYARHRKRARKTSIAFEEWWISNVTSEAEISEEMDKIKEISSRAWDAALGISIGGVKRFLNKEC